MSVTLVAAPPARIRRKRRLAATLRSLVAQEAALSAASSGLASSLAGSLAGRGARRPDDPVATRLRSIAGEQRVPAEADADLPELLARIAAAHPVPAEVCAAMVAILLPILHLPHLPGTDER